MKRKCKCGCLADYHHTDKFKYWQIVYFMCHKCNTRTPYYLLSAGIFREARPIILRVFSAKEKRRLEISGRG